MRDLDAELIQAALEKGLISQEELERVDRLVQGSQGKLYRAQVMVRERIITTSELITLQNQVRASIYECPKCKQRHSRKALPKQQGKSFKCKGCGKTLKEEPASLSRIEVLTSRDPRDLTIPLRPKSVSESASEISAIDLDRYEVEEELGRGGYGVVFRAFHRDLEREVALKVLRAGVALPEIALERFIREARSASRLKHPNIVSVYDIGRHRDLFAIAMELVKGSSLKVHLKKRGRLPWAEAVGLMHGVLKGVEHAHDAGIIHRDLKPTNIIIDEDGRPRLIDFGLAKDLKSDAALTIEGAIVGTPFYLSPEQVEGRSAEADARSDVFSLGVILYLLLSGKRPFVSRLKNEVYQQILECKPTPLGELVPELPLGVVDIVETAMARHSKDRFASAGAMREALEEFIELDSQESTRSSTTRSRSGTRRTKRSSKKVSRPRKAAAAPNAPAARDANNLKLALIAGGVLVIGLLGFIIGQGSSDPGEKTREVASKTTPPPPVRKTQDPVSKTRETRGSGPKTPRVDPNDPRFVKTPEMAKTVETVPGLELRDPEHPEPTDTRTEPTDSKTLEPVDSKTPKPDPTPRVDPEPAVALDTGKQDAKEFPDLAHRSQKNWLKRAFFINAVADSHPTARNVRALRFALNDRHPVNRAFALRGLTKISPDMLRAFGSQALFDALLDLVNEKEVYRRRTTRALLARLAKTPHKSKSAWKKWWRDEGKALFLEAARHPPQIVIPPIAERKQTERLHSRARKVTRYFSSLRDRGIDILLLMDVTMSMTDELVRMKRQVKEITSFMGLLLKNKVRMGFVTYGDQVVKRAPLTAKLPAFARSVEGISIFNDPKDKTVKEGVSTALAEALHPENRVGWRKKSIRTILLLGDAPPLDQDKCKDLAKQAGEAGFVLNALIAPPPTRYANQPADPTFTELAKLGKGMASRIEKPEDLITRILVFAFGPSQEEDLKRFVVAYREVTGQDSQSK